MRIFFAFNNRWLVENEVPALIKQGHSVFIPKKPIISANSIVTYNYDKRLALPENVLEELNNIDFFSGILERKIIELIDEYFDVFLLDCNEYLMQCLILFYTKKIILRPLRYSSKMNITKWVKDNLGFWALKNIEKLKDRFYVSLLSGKILDCNDIISSECMLELPFILPKINDSIKVESKNKDIIFICPEIKSDYLAGENYKKFEKEFKDFSYDIIGKQLIPINNNKKVISVENYEDYLKDYKVLFYMSGDEKEIPFYLFEAFQIGIPVVFMSGGYLDIFNTEKFLGRCNTIEKARRLCKKIINRDKKIIKIICREQDELVESIYKKNIYSWSTVLSVIKKPLKTNVNNSKVKKLAVIMPGEYTGGVLDYTIRLILAIKRGAEISGNNLEIVFGHVKHVNYEKKEYFKELRDKFIPIRSYKWEEFGKERIEEALSIQGYNFEGLNEKYVNMNDGITYFEDCDCLLFTADRIHGELYSTVPYALILHDYIQRYVPRIMNGIVDKSFLDVARMSISNFTTTNVVKTESIQYAGIEKCRTNLIPLFFGSIGDVEKDKEWLSDIGEYFIWSTNPSVHKNHIFALNALIKYYESGGKLKCIITGADTEMFKSSKAAAGSSYVNEIRDVIKTNKSLKENMEILGNMPKSTYLKTLKNAKFFLHPGCADNGNGTAFDAAMLGVPTLSCDYPAMRNMDEKTKMNMQFFENNDVDGLADLIKKQEESKRKWDIPSREELEKHIITNDQLCTDIYQVMRSYLPI
ncbi:glycosyltransferase family protein [Anaerocolumna xylanovorans]|uniref:Glycosyltransferase involved in cell wall bisynthesis n=1 Tax=Anaerocolumna xylanovorans DSM 12503 TaxID=1121345 RepID=A0A1M7Y499_9FIRM|nr:glycosyltransferase [Anaerocolumna xylanovorans]SHO47114.1 Glycosyltransferase involved in cell wall bisynthesis [Anaerocolumna xylanovorans DSM 12503]